MALSRIYGQVFNVDAEHIIHETYDVEIDPEIMDDVIASLEGQEEVVFEDEFEHNGKTYVETAAANGFFVNWNRNSIRLLEAKVEIKEKVEQNESLRNPLSLDMGYITHKRSNNLIRKE